MTTEYTPNGSVWEPLVAIPSGSDPPAAATFQAGIEGCADREQWLYNNSVNVYETTFLSGGTFTLTQTTAVTCFGAGGGGAGGDGSVGPGNNNAETMPGGSGGAASLATVRTIVMPAGTYTVVVGAGATSSGAAGADTTIADAGANIYARWKGGAGGLSAAGLAVVSTTHTGYLSGGEANYQFAYEAPAVIVVPTAQGTPLLPHGPGAGGAGVGSPEGAGNFSFGGIYGLCGGPGGAGGVQGSASGSLAGGGGGGGGGGGTPLSTGASGAGGAGGAGGNANGSGGGGAGGNGGNASSNTGAGGGGGGSAGAGSGGVGTPGTHGNGGAGFLIISYASVGVHT